MGAVSGRGFSLLELLAVVLILAVLGMAAVISLRPAASLCLDGAAQEVAEGLRFARSEALRRGEPIAFHVKSTTTRIRVYEPRPSNTTAADASVPDPLTKRDYEHALSDLPGCGRIAVQDPPAPFAFASSLGRDAVAFDARGDPFYSDSGLSHPLTSGAVVLQLDGESRSVALSALGRVTLP